MTGIVICLCGRQYVLTIFVFFFFNDTATTEIYTLSLHDALPICLSQTTCIPTLTATELRSSPSRRIVRRSEEHTSELQSPCNLVCRLLLEKKKLQPPSNSDRCKKSNFR